MTILFLTLGLMLILVAGMAIGTILANKPLKGSCGGLSALGMKESCMICGGDESQWQREAEIVKQQVGGENLAYDALQEPAKKS